MNIHWAKVTGAQSLTHNYGLKSNFFKKLGHQCLPVVFFCLEKVPDTDPKEVLRKVKTKADLVDFIEKFYCLEGSIHRKEQRVEFLNFLKTAPDVTIVLTPPSGKGAWSSLGSAFMVIGTAEFAVAAILQAKLDSKECSQDKATESQYRQIKLTLRAILKKTTDSELVKDRVSELIDVIVLEDIHESQKRKL
jgi:hypothetical protein